MVKPILDTLIITSFVFGCGWVAHGVWAEYKEKKRREEKARQAKVIDYSYYIKRNNKNQWFI